jgi:O-acetyl-ADP-ribose deacetylase (regulator of RNase III)
MIRYTQGNLLEAPVQAFVNTVNEVGVMGKGIALMFRESFPQNTLAYEAACRAHEVRVGKMFVTCERDLTGQHWIINFPTKKHWRNPSKFEWIRDGLKDLVNVVRENQITSIAVPPLGCGNGGLEWAQVRREMEAAFMELAEVEIIIYAPTEKYQNAPKRAGVEELTAARALIADLIRRYSVLGLDCTNLEVQKLAWFLSRVVRKLSLPDTLGLQYAANKFGPYADNLRHLLNGLDGSYLHCEKRLSDAGPLDLIWFEESKRETVASFFKKDIASRYLPALEETAEIIDGFESPLGMELLATVDWIVTEMKREPSLSSVKEGLSDWPGGQNAARRKQKLFDDRLLSLALSRLEKANLPLEYDVTSS